MRAVFTRKATPKNAGSYFGYIDEAQYVAGIVAGSTSKTGKLGFVAAKPIPQVLRNINAFTLGARSVNPKATTRVVFTGDWALPVKRPSPNGLIDQGADVVTMHVDSPKVIIETAERRGVYSSGYHANQSTLAPKGYLTGAESAMITEAILSFIGAGTPPNIPSWGNIMAEARSLFQIAVYLILFPGLFLSLTVLAVNLLGDGMRDALDPRLARRM